LHEIAVKINHCLPTARGILCFQVIEDIRSGLRVIEINARFGGGYPLADHAGATFAQWLLEEIVDVGSTAHNNWRNNVTMLRYDAAVFKG
jgi:carbamoyl-phosphate synthase large subunit